jgi:Replicase family/Primase C terminal 1 (PriCT-1)
MSIILSHSDLQTELFAPDLWPRTMLCTDDYAYGSYRRRQSQALKRAYIQPNLPFMRFRMVYDIDRPGGGMAWEDVGLPPPTWAAVNPENAHAHLVYGIAAPVYTCEAKNQRPLRYLHAIESGFKELLDADQWYTGNLTKNPLHRDWRTLWGPVKSFDLGFLAEFVDLKRHSPRPDVKVSEVGVGRNVTLFNFTRSWAYRAVRKYERYEPWHEAVLQRCLARNGDFLEPMNYNEVKAIARSIAKWVWSRFDLAASDAKFSKLQSFRRSFGGGAPPKIIVLE